jgi:hypothetical protein
MVKNQEIASAVVTDTASVIAKMSGSYVGNVPAAAGLEESTAAAAMPKAMQAKPFKDAK